MKRTKQASRVMDSPTKRARKVLIFDEDEMDVETVEQAVNWLEGISAELWIMALEKAGAGRLDFDWIQKFSLINQNTYRYTFSTELWRYLYESMLVAPAARPTHLLDDISNVSTPSYRSLREESQIHYTFYLPYVFHYGLKGDGEGKDYKSEADLPEWKVWKRMVEVLRRRRMMILNKIEFDNLDGTSTPDPSKAMSYSDTTDKTKLDDSNGNSDYTLGTEYNTHLSRIGPAVVGDRSIDELNFTNEHFDTSNVEDPRNRAGLQEVHRYAIRLNDTGDIVTRSLPACPWPIVYGVDPVQGAWVGLVLPHKIIYAGLLETGRHALDRYRRMDQIFSLVAQPDGLLNIFCLGTSTDIDEPPAAGNLPNPPEELIVWMHTVRLDVLIREAIDHIKTLDFIRKYSKVEWHNIQDFVVGQPRVFFSLSPTSTRFARFPSSQWILDKRFNYMPLALSASRRYLAFTFHHGCQLFEWSYNTSNVVAYDFFNWELLSKSHHISKVSAEYADTQISETYTNKNTILPYIKMIMHPPDGETHQVAASMDPFNPDILFRANGTNRMTAPYPENHRTKHVDVAEIRCDPLGSNRLIVVIGVSSSDTATYTDSDKRISYYPILYMALGMVMHPKLIDTRFNYIGYYDTLDTPAFDDTPNRLLRDSLDGVAIMIPTPEIVHDMEDRTVIVNILERVKLSVVGWIDVSDRRRSLPLLTTFTHNITDALMTRTTAWDYLPTGLLVTAYEKIIGRVRNEDALIVSTGFNFIMPARGGWRARDEKNKPQVVSRKFNHQRVINGIYVQGVISQPKNIVLFAGGNTFMTYNLMRFYVIGRLTTAYILQELMLNLSRYELGPNRFNDKFVTYIGKNAPLPDPLVPKNPSSPITQNSRSLDSSDSLDELVDKMVVEDETKVPRPGIDNYLSANKLRERYIQ